MLFPIYTGFAACTLVRPERIQAFTSLVGIITEYHLSAGISTSDKIVPPGIVMGG